MLLGEGVIAYCRLRFINNKEYTTTTTIYNQYPEAMITR